MPSSSDFQSIISYDLTATIASGQTESGVVDLGGTQLVGLFLPSTFDGTTLSIQAALTAGGTFVPVYADGADLGFTVAAAKAVGFENLAPLAGWRFIKLVAGTSQSTSDTVITLVTRPL